MGWVMEGEVGAKAARRGERQGELGADFTLLVLSIKFGDLQISADEGVLNLEFERQ
jgi:hypothetical protein